MTNAEAKTKIKKIMCEEIDRLPSHFDGEDEVYDSTKDVDEILKLNKTVCKALEIADRLEQADKSYDIRNESKKRMEDTSYVYPINSLDDILIKLILGGDNNG